MPYRRTLLLVGVLWSALATAQPDRFASDQCYKLQSHADVRVCLETQSNESAAGVAQAEDDFRSALARWDQELEYRARTRSNFDAAVLSFKSYREAQCEFQASLAAGGNAAGDQRLLCNIQLNGQRMAQVKAAAHALK